MNACIDCGSHYCTPLRRNDPSGIIAYWFASLKDSQDFLILMSDLKIRYYTWGDPEFPRDPDLLEKYDWYCSQCFLKIMYNKKIVVGDWIRDAK